MLVIYHMSKTKYRRSLRSTDEDPLSITLSKCIWAGFSTLRAKTWLVIGSTLVIFLLVFYLPLRYIVLDSFHRLEERSVQRELAHTTWALQKALADLSGTAGSYVALNDSVALVATPRREFSDANLLEPIFINLRLNLVVIADASGQIVDARAYDLDLRRELPPPPQFQQELPVFLRTPAAMTSSINGIVATSDGPFLIASQPIVQKQRSGFSGGTFIIGRALVATDLHHLSETSDLDANIYSIGAPNLPADVRSALESLLAGAPEAILMQDVQTISGYSLLNDIAGQPVLILRVALARQLYAQGQNVLTYLTLALVASGLCFGLVSIFLFACLFSSRISRLDAEITRIGAHGLSAARITVPSKDEIGHLAMSINAMLEALEKAQTAQQHAEIEHSRLQSEEARLAMENKLLEAQRLESLRLMAGGIAHEFNNLLTIILGNANLITLDQQHSSAVWTSVVQIEQAVRRAAELTNQLLAYSGHGRFVIGPLNFNILIEEMTSLLRASVARTVRLQFQLAPDLPAIDADASQIRQMLLNLVVNAAEAIGDATGAITIKTALIYADQADLATIYRSPDLRSGHYVLLEIVDTGRGMDEETLGRIFEPFFTTKFIGRGLGLAAVLGIVRGHGGALRVRSAVGSGSTFTAVFPIIDDTHAKI